MRLSLLVVAASFKQVSAQSGSSLTNCHSIYGNVATTNYTLNSCNQTGSWLETGATTCYFGYDNFYDGTDSGTGPNEYAGCGEQINCKAKHDALLEKGLLNGSEPIFCIWYTNGDFDLPPKFSADYVSMYLCCQAIDNTNYHQESNEWTFIPDTGIRKVGQLYRDAQNNGLTFSNEVVATTTTTEESEEEEYDYKTTTIVLGSVCGALLLGGAAYIIKKKVYDKDASFMPLQFLL